MNPSNETSRAQKIADGPQTYGGASDDQNMQMAEPPYYPVPKETPDEERKELPRINIPIFHPDLNNMGVDELMTKSFADILQKKVDSGEWREKASDALETDFQDMKACVRPAFYWGAATAVAQFCFLRWAGARWMNRSMHKGPLWPWRLALKTGRESEMVQSAKLEKNPWHHRIETRKDGKTKFREGRSTLPLTIALDAVVSLMSGCVVGFVKVDKLKLYDSVANIPLKQGRSPVSEVLCYDFLKQDAKIPTELWEEHDDDAMKALRKFLDNCLLRVAHEHQIRKESNLKPDEPVSIPPPGVPSNAWDVLQEQELFGEGRLSDDVDASGRRKGAAGGSAAAWSPEDYNLWVNDVEDDWEVTDDLDDDS